MSRELPINPAHAVWLFLTTNGLDLSFDRVTPPITLPNPLLCQQPQPVPQVFKHGLASQPPHQLTRREVGRLLGGLALAVVAKNLVDDGKETGSFTEELDGVVALDIRVSNLRNLMICRQGARTRWRDAIVEAPTALLWTPCGTPCTRCSPGAGLVADPDAEVLNGGHVLLVAREDLAVRLLHLLQAGEEVPELGLRAGVVGAPQLHAVHLGIGHRIGGDMATHDVELTVLLT